MNSARHGRRECVGCYDWVVNACMRTGKLTVQCMFRTRVLDQIPQADLELFD